MKTYLWKILLLLTITFSVVGCFESDAENAIEDVGENIEEVADDAKDGVEDAADDVEDAVNN